jgi:tight adherence protein C
MIVALGAAAVILLVRTRLLEARSRTQKPAADDFIALATLISLGLDAGMTPAVAIAWARPYVHPTLATAVTAVTRRGHLDGLAIGLRSAVGFGSNLFVSVARAVETGAALGPILDSYQDQVQAEARAAAEARLRRLPVKLVFPLALLMLPGLVLMVSGPALIDVIGRFA